MNVGDTVFSDNEERFIHEDWEEALNAAWDQADPTEKVLSIWEGVIGPKRVYDYESFEDANEVVNVKERRFEVIKFAEYFELEDFREITVPPTLNKLRYSNEHK